jgi:hypothetical protein
VHRMARKKKSGKKPVEQYDGGIESLKIMEVE